jgi:PAS domain S-box-containing protein
VKINYHPEAVTPLRVLAEARQAVEPSDTYFRTIANSIPQLAWMAEADGHIIWYNQRWFDYTGTTPQQMEASGWRSVHDPRVLPTLITQWQSSIASGQPFDMEFPLRGVDGSFRVFLTCVAPLKDAEGNVVQWFGTHTDISERSELQRNEELIAAVEDAGDAIIGENLDGTITSWNLGAQRLFGYTPDEMIGQPLRRLLTPDRVEEEEKILAQVRLGERVESYETVRRRKDGRLVEVSVTISPIQDGQVWIIGASKIARDITELKKKEAAKLRSLEQLREQAAVLELAQVVVRDMDSLIVQWSLGAERLYGFSKEEALGHVSHELFQTEFPQPLAQIEATLRRTGRWEGELVHRKQNGERLVLASQQSVYHDGTGRPVRILEANIDITERTRAQKALETRNLDLQQFAYIASHDLKTPLRTISGFVELLQKNYGEQLGTQGADWIRRTSEGAHRLETRIDNLLLYSRLDSRAEPFESVDCRAVFQEALDCLTSLILEAKAEVTAGELPIVMGDPAQLVQLFQNLIDNGIKYRSTSRPRIHVSAKREKGDWLFSVADNGMGINPQHHERIFELFRRLHTQKAYPGDGIGLSLCRRIVGRHGGRIWVESEFGKGCTFFFTLNYQTESKP